MSGSSARLRTFAPLLVATVLALVALFTVRHAACADPGRYVPVAGGGYALVGGCVDPRRHRGARSPGPQPRRRRGPHPILTVAHQARNLAGALFVAVIPRWRAGATAPKRGWSPSTARCGCARARASSRSAPTCSRSRATPPPPCGCTPRPGAQPARGHALAAAPGHHGAPGARRRDALDRVAYEEAWQAGARLTLDDLEPAPARASVPSRNFATARRPSPAFRLGH